MKSLITLLLLAASIAQAKDAPTPVRKPNILWLISEDTGPQLGCYGTTNQVWTPNLDRLAAEGVRYTHFYVGMVCSVSRSSFNTGMHAVSINSHNHRCKNGPPLPDGVRPLTEWMRDAGYFTVNVKTLPEACGFSGTGKTDWNFAHVKQPFDSDAWADLKSHQPFYAQIHTLETHRPYIAPERADPAKVEIPPFYPDHPVARKDWAKYLDSISNFDIKVGRVLQQLERDGLADNTIVVYFGDNGAGCLRGKGFCYEEGFHVPLIIRWPKNFPAPAQIKPGTVDDRLLDGIDLAPTMLAIAGIPKPSKMQGRIFLGDKTEAPREYVFGTRDRLDSKVTRIRSVRDTRYRYIRNFTPDKSFLASSSSQPVLALLKQLHAAGKLTPAQAFLCQPRMPDEELYDLQSDPWEIRNLAQSPEHQAELKRLRGVLEKWMADVNDRVPDPKTTSGKQPKKKKL